MDVLLRTTCGRPLFCVLLYVVVDTGVALLGSDIGFLCLWTDLSTDAADWETWAIWPRPPYFRPWDWMI